MAQALESCRADGTLTPEEYEATVAKCRTIEGEGTPEENAVELLIVTAFISEHDLIEERKTKRA
jgi:hypothetical protein